jgi:hypothetical protein
MKRMTRVGLPCLLLLGVASCVDPPPSQPPSTSLFAFPEGVETRWASFENPAAEKGQGGRANRGAKDGPPTRSGPVRRWLSWT